MPRKKKTAASGEKTVSKSDFIRAETKAGKKAAEIVEAGKAAGVALTIAHVYAVQSSDRKKAGTTRKTKGKSGPKPKTTGKRADGGWGSSGFTSDERHFVGLIKKIGVARAETLVGLTSAFLDL